tara:strand:+ start:1351 stop:1575 length:225 start_codon:yes stop_codon:yes gene_type:complete
LLLSIIKKGKQIIKRQRNNVIGPRVTTQCKRLTGITAATNNNKGLSSMRTGIINAIKRNTAKIIAKLRTRCMIK